MTRVVALLADYVRQEASARVYEPVAHLVDGEAGTLGQDELLVLCRVGIVAVLVEPHLEHFNAVLGQVAAAFAVVDRAVGSVAGGI